MTRTRTRGKSEKSHIKSRGCAESLSKSRRKRRKSSGKNYKIRGKSVKSIRNRKNIRS